MKRLNTATVTWISYRNFGTFLQAYALQQSLIKIGCCNRILSDKKIVDTFFPNNWKSIISNFVNRATSLFNAFEKGQRRSNRAYDDFARRFLKIDYDWKNFEELNHKYDIFICGSDQIWSPIVPFDAYFYLDFTTKKKIAYAPSIGSSVYPQEKVSQIKPYLLKFSHLSIREEQGKEILEKQFGLTCQTVLDPTLLLDKEEWEKFITVEKDQNYILCYFLTFNEVYWKFVQQFANEKGLLLKALIIHPQDLNYVDEPLYVGPKGFLNAIKNSRYFFTDSFHGSVFAVHFEKQFVAFKRFKETSEQNQNSRIVNLFKKLGLTDLFVSESDLSKVNIDTKIDFSAVKEKLSLEQSKSLKYLQQAILQ